MPTFVHDGHVLHYDVHGSGRPVVMLHGITVTFAANYAAVGWVQSLAAKGLQPIGLDFRGHGGSAKPLDPAAYGTVNLAGDVIALLDELRIGRASLIGYSLGSTIALYLLHAFPDRWERGVLIATGDGLLDIPPYTSAKVLPQLRASLLRDAFPADLPAHVAAYWEFATRLGHRESSAVAANGVYPPCQTAEAARVRVPVLVISGEKDPVLGTGPRLTQALPQGRYLEIAGADHFSMARDPAVQSAAADFLASA